MDQRGWAEVGVAWESTAPFSSPVCLNPHLSRLSARLGGPAQEGAVLDRNYCSRPTASHDTVAAVASLLSRGSSNCSLTLRHHTPSMPDSPLHARSPTRTKSKPLCQVYEPFLENGTIMHVHWLHGVRGSGAWELSLRGLGLCCPASGPGPQLQQLFT